MITQTDARSILNSFFRHFRLFMLFFIPLNLAALLYICVATPSYESTAKLLVKFGPDVRPEIASDRNSNGGTSSADEHHELVQSNVKILTSRDLAEVLLNEVTLQRAYPKIAKNPPHSGTIMDAAVKHFYKDLVVKTDNDSSVITVSLFNPDPATSVDMLHRLDDLFITRQSQIYSNPQTGVLREQASEAYNRLQDTTKKLNDYKAQAGIASIDEELSLLLQARSDIAGFLSRHPTNAASSSGAASADAGTLSVLPARFPVSTGDRFPTLDDVQRKLDDLRARQAELAQTYSPNSDVMRNLRDNISAESAAQTLSLKALNTQIADLDRQIAEKNERKAVYEDLKRDVELAEDNYKSAETRSQDAGADQDLNLRKITQISVIQQPTVASKPSRPHTAVVLALCLLSSIALGFAACIAAESLDRSFSLPEQAEFVLGVPVLASFARVFTGNKDHPRPHHQPLLRTAP